MRKLTADKLGAALTQVTTDEKMIEKARLLGERIRAEDGVGNAVAAFYRDLPTAYATIQRIREHNAEKNTSRGVFGLGLGLGLGQGFMGTPAASSAASSPKSK